MFARRQDQENLLHARHGAAVGKERSLNGAAPKTPAKRMQKPLHDENNVVTVKGGKEKNQFQVFATPAAPQTRAPLGAKTTNAKATAFLTPAHAAIRQKNVNKTISPRLRKSKIKVHDAEVIAESNDEIEEREIEYAPPRETPLPDYPDEDIWPHDRTYPQFEGENMTKGWATAFFKPSESDDEDFAAKIKKIELAERNLDTATGPTTVSLKSAAQLLSKKPTTNSFAAETSSSRARKITPVNGNARHTAAKVASNTTVGYSKGRLVFGVARKPSSLAESEKKPQPRRALPDLFTQMSDDDRELVARAEDYEEAELKRMEAEFMTNLDDL